MDIFTRADLKALLAEQAETCVSLFMPAHRGGSEQDPIRFRQLLGQAEERLVAGGMRAPEARDRLASLRALLDEPGFWPSQSDGLAAFQAGSFQRVYRLPWAFAEEVQVGRTFRVVPLLPLLAGDGRFFVLAISQNAVRLLQGTRFAVSPVALKNLPASMAEALRTHDRDEVLNFDGRVTSGGGWGAIFHGQGVGIDDKKDDLALYFRAIDRGLHELLREEKAPLVLAATGYCLPLYREANTYPGLLEQGIEGSPDRLGDKDLHSKAWEIVKPRFDESMRRAVALYAQAAPAGRATCDSRQVAHAACRGEIETLFVAAGKHLWGVLGAAPEDVELHQERMAGDEELLNLAATHALRHGNTVYVLPPAEMPAGEFLAGIRHLPRAKHGKGP